MTLIDDLNSAVNKVIAEFKTNATIIVDEDLKKENEDLKTAISSAIANLSTVVPVNPSNMAEPIVTTVTPPEDKIPS